MLIKYKIITIVLISIFVILSILAYFSVRLNPDYHKTVESYTNVYKDGSTNNFIVGGDFGKGMIKGSSSRGDVNIISNRILGIQLKY